MDLSIVIPVYNEEDSIAPLYEAIIRAVEPLGCTFETLLIDDGSTDDTFNEALQIANRDARFRLLKLNKNYGQTAALKAGFDQAQGTIIVTMDGDLQNDPEDIEKLIQKVQEGNDLVVGWRKDRQDGWFSRKIPSRIANSLVRKVTGVPLSDNGCALRAYRAEVLTRFPLYSEMHRLLPTMLALAGACIAEIEVKHHPRTHGVSKYGLSRTYKVLLDLIALRTIMILVRKPLAGFGVAGVLFAILGLLAFLAGLAQFLIDPKSTLVVFIGISLLWGSLSIFVLMLGLLADLVYTTGKIKVEKLLKPKIT